MEQKTKQVRFNKSTLANLVAAGNQVIIKDSEIAGLKFKVGARRSVFQFEKRIKGKRCAPITFSIGAFPALSIEEARQEARRLANLCEKGIDPRKEKDLQNEEPVLFSEVLERFFMVKKGLAIKTLKTYNDIVKSYVPKTWMGKDIQSFTSDLLVEQFHEVRKTANDGCWKFLTLISNIWNTCAPLFRDQANHRTLGQNPVPEARAMLKHVTKAAPKRTVIGETFLGRFVVTLENLKSNNLVDLNSSTPGQVAPGTVRMCEIALLSLFTGFRFAEARHLKWEYVNLEHGIIQLPGDARQDAGSFDGTKNNLDHWVPLSTYAWELLREIDRKKSSTLYVFPSVRDPNKPAAREVRVYNMISEKVGTHYTPHAARRTFASAANEVGLGFLTVKRMLNHAYQGGVTGGYVVPGFNPSRERANFQKVCDYILDRRAEFLGESLGTVDKKRAALIKVRQYIRELGLSTTEVLHELESTVSISEVS
jgi:integrase